MSLFSRARGRLRALDEAAAYSRCHGYRTQTIVVVRSTDAALDDPAPPERLPRQTPRDQSRVSGEQLRQRFEQLLDARQRQD
jgi:hypothetical protein